MEVLHYFLLMNVFCLYSELMFRSRNRSLPSGITVSSSTNLDSVVARVRERERESNHLFVTSCWKD